MLRRRADSFLARPEYASVRALLADISTIGPVAIFGGFLRDLARHGIGGFNSDLDVVIDCESAASVLRRLGTVRFNHTGMGGIRILGNRLQVDLWTLQDTWAIKNGIVGGSRLADLVHTTFFDCDAVIYQLSSRDIVCADSYFAALQSGVIDINIETNPNPLSMAIRTLRFLKRRQLKISDRLGRYLLRSLQEFGIENICKSEQRRYKDHCLEYKWVKFVEHDLRIHRECFPLSPYGVNLNRRAFTDCRRARMEPFAET